MSKVIDPETVYSVGELHKLTGMGMRNIERSAQRGAIQARLLSGKFYAIRGKDFLTALEEDKAGRVRLSKPIAV